MAQAHFTAFLAGVGYHEAAWRRGLHRGVRSTAGRPCAATLACGDGRGSRGWLRWVRSHAYVRDETKDFSRTDAWFLYTGVLMAFDFSLPERVEQWRDRFRIYDGASEVHRMWIAKRAARRARADA